MWCRWGRVGETGATKEVGPFTSEASASAAFAKKFQEKSGNKWKVRKMRGLLVRRSEETLVGNPIARRVCPL